MSKKFLIGLSIIGILVIVGVAAYILRPPAEASAPIEALPVVVEEGAAGEMESQVEEPAVSEDSETDEIPTVEEEAQADEPAVEEPADQEPVENADTSFPEGVVVFTIVQAESEVRFTLGELLSGVPTTVVGATDQVAGEIAIDPVDPSSATVGVIRVNARTFRTDNDFRNRAINNQILETGKYEFVTFTPAEITSFPENPTIGQPLTFQISGDLSVRDIINPITFDVTVTAVSETRLEGTAAAMISRADYDLQIPEVPRVADVDEEVLLEIDFVAVAK